MTDQEHLERGYRRLLVWYPRAFRQQNGPEILAVLMACARHGQRRPGLAQAADLIRSGLWMRLRPGVPRSARTVRAAVRLMYAGAVVSTVNLIVVLAVLGDVKARHAVFGHRFTAAQVSQVNTLFITLTIVTGLVPVALWLWMARESGQGRNWARGLSTVLFGLATLELSHAIGGPGIVFGGTVFGAIFPVLTWLAGLAAVCLLWLPASSAFFRPRGFAEARHLAQMAELARLRSSRARLSRPLSRSPTRMRPPGDPSPSCRGDFQHRVRRSDRIA
jgi:hypothetical protein